MAKLYNNPALQEEAWDKPIQIILPRKNESLYDWIESTGRFKLNEADKSHNDEVKEDLEDLLETPIYNQDQEEEDKEGWVS
ncbi:DUF3134 family protein [Lyngbya aestuarii]|uniref:DUF3134 family protein n=1 Tax=Lyngbya aestuarii TaxID=118322 RepID=UPI00403E0E1A